MMCLRRDDVAGAASLPASRPDREQIRIDANFEAGAGHVVSTLLIASVVWLAGFAAAARFGRFVETGSSIAFVIFGGWIALSAWREARGQGGPTHGHKHPYAVRRLSGKIHGPELQRIPTDHGELSLSIHEAGGPPRFRLSPVRFFRGPII